MREGRNEISRASFAFNFYRCEEGVFGTDKTEGVARAGLGGGGDEVCV